MTDAPAFDRETLTDWLKANGVTHTTHDHPAVFRVEEGLDLKADLPGARISFHGNDGGKLSEVIYRLDATAHDQALARAHADMQRRMLRWLVQIGRGLALAGWRIADPAHGARWRCTPFRPSAMRAAPVRVAKSSSRSGVARRRISSLPTASAMASATASSRSLSPRR